MAEARGIRVICRFRPQNSMETERGGTCCVDFLDEFSCRVKEHQFTFDRVFDGSSTQSAIYEHIKPVVVDLLDGFNATIFAYGQTSSGKTHTMQGPSMDDPELRGIIPRVIDGVFQSVSEAPAETEFTLHCSYMEIYLERIRDLLDPRKENLKIRESRESGIYVDSLTELCVSSPAEVDQALRVGQHNRAVAATGMNQQSSRSHSVFVLGVRSKAGGATREGRLFLVDLAGSEKVGKTGAMGLTLSEAKMINKSLSALGNVIKSLVEAQEAIGAGGQGAGSSNAPHIPYRDSKLTRILQESLGGNARTTLVINCSPSSYNEDETVSTLRFGSRAKAIKNRARANVERSPAELRAMLKKAEAEIARLQGLLEGKGIAFCQESSTEAPKDSAKTEELEKLVSELRDSQESLKDQLAEKQMELERSALESLQLKSELSERTTALEGTRVRLEEASLHLERLTNENRSIKSELEDKEQRELQGQLTSLRRSVTPHGRLSVTPADSSSMAFSPRSFSGAADVAKMEDDVRETIQRGLDRMKEVENRLKNGGDTASPSVLLQEIWEIGQELVLKSPRPSLTPLAANALAAEFAASQQGGSTTTTGSSVDKISEMATQALLLAKGVTTRRKRGSVPSKDAPPAPSGAAAPAGSAQSGPIVVEDVEDGEERSSADVPAADGDQDGGEEVFAETHPMATAQSPGNWDDWDEQESKRRAHEADERPEESTVPAVSSVGGIPVVIETPEPPPVTVVPPRVPMCSSETQTEESGVARQTTEADAQTDPEPPPPPPKQTESLEEWMRNVEAQHAEELARIKESHRAESEKLKQESMALQTRGQQFNASSERVISRLTEELTVIKSDTERKLLEFKKVREALLVDLENRCLRVVDLQMQLDEMYEKYDSLRKSKPVSNDRVLKKQILSQQRELQRAVREMRRYSSENQRLHADGEVARKQLLIRNEYVKHLEAETKELQKVLRDSITRGGGGGGSGPAAIAPANATTAGALKQPPTTSTVPLVSGQRLEASVTVPGWQSGQRHPKHGITLVSQQSANIVKTIRGGGGGHSQQPSAGSSSSSLASAFVATDSAVPMSSAWKIGDSRAPQVTVVSASSRGSDDQEDKEDEDDSQEDDEDQEDGKASRKDSDHEEMTVQQFMSCTEPPPSPPLPPGPDPAVVR